MNVQSDVLSGVPAESRAIASPRISFGRQFYWTVRRELWENHSLYIAPAAVAGLIVAAVAIGLGYLRLHMGQFVTHFSKQNGLDAQQPLQVVALLIMATSLLVAVFYSLDALYGERRDRSILFWKSLPVSDLTTVLSKLTIPVLVLPVITFAITVVTQCLLLLIVFTALLGSGLHADALGLHVSLIPASIVLLYHLVVVHGLWFAPLYGWLLLVSAFARRAPLLWAILVPAAIALVEKIIFRTDYFAMILRERFNSGPGSAMAESSAMSLDGVNGHSALLFLVSPGMLLGLAVTAVFVAGAMRLRRSQGPI